MAQAYTYNDSSILHYVDENGYDWYLTFPDMYVNGQIWKDTELHIDNVPLNVALSWLNNPTGPFFFIVTRKVDTYAGDSWKGPLAPFKNIAFSAPWMNSKVFVYPSSKYSGNYQISGETNVGADVQQNYIDAFNKGPSVFQQILTTAAIFAAAAATVGALTPSASAAVATGTTDVAVASGSTIPTYIAAPTIESGIPEYIAASTPAAALPVDAALGTDASILGLTGGTAESSIYGTVENLISQGKDIVSQYKPVISDIGKLETAYKGVSTVAKKPVPKAAPVQPSGAPAQVSQTGGLIPIGIILGLLLLAA